MGPISSRETSILKQTAISNIPEDGRIQVNCSESLRYPTVLMRVTSYAPKLLLKISSKIPFQLISTQRFHDSVLTFTISLIAILYLYFRTAIYGSSVLHPSFTLLHHSLMTPVGINFLPV